MKICYLAAFSEISSDLAVGSLVSSLVSHDTGALFAVSQ